MSFLCGHFHVNHWNNFFCNTFCRASDCSNQVKWWVLHWLLHSKRNKPSLTKENGKHLWSSARVSSRTASVFNSYLYNTDLIFLVFYLYMTKKQTNRFRAFIHPYRNHGDIFFYKNCARHIQLSLMYIKCISNLNKLLYMFCIQN